MAAVDSGARPRGLDALELATDSAASAPASAGLAGAVGVLVLEQVRRRWRDG